MSEIHGSCRVKIWVKKCGGKNSFLEIHVLEMLQILVQMISGQPTGCKALGK